MKWITARLGTLGLYSFAVIGGSSWDRDPNSWSLTILHVISASFALWWAVARSIRHEAENRRDDQA